MYLAKRLVTQHLQKIENSPDFGTLSYADQAKIYAVFGIVYGLLYIGDSIRETNVNSVSAGTIVP